MPTITFTLSDTPSGAVAIHSSFSPAIGAPCSPAQSAALEILARTRKQYDLATPARTSTGAPSTGSVLKAVNHGSTQA